MRILTALLLCFSLFAHAAAHAIERDLLEAEQAFRFSARALDANTLEVRYQIADGYYLYREKFKFSAEPADIQLGAARFPVGQIKQDEYLGKVETYRNEIAVTIPFTRSGNADRITLHATSQGCADTKVCYPPLTQSANITLPAAGISGKTAPPANTMLAAMRQFSNRLGGAEPEFLPADQAFQLFVKATDAHTLEADFEVAEGYYLYRDKIKFTLKNGVTSIKHVALPTGEIKNDPGFGRVVVYHHPFQAVVTLKNSGEQAKQIILNAVFQGCSEKGICYPPQSKSINLALPGARPTAVTPSAESAPPKAGATQPAAAPPLVAAPPKTVTPATVVAPLKTATPPDATPPPKTAAPPSTEPPTAAAPPVAPPRAAPAADDSSRIAALLKGGGFWLIITSFFGFGLLLALTPCVFPMIPILSGIIVGQGQHLTKGRTFALSLAYVLGMAITYALAGIAAGLSGALISNALQNPWALSGFALVFVLLAFSMFGFYELQMPNFIQSWFNKEANQIKGGNLAGVFAMGALSAVIVGPCVAAPLAGALLYIGQTSDVVLGGAALFALALGMGVPLLLVGMSAGALLPRAGAWMSGVKNFFGVLMLGMAIWLVSPVISAALHMLLWAALLIVSAVYLHALDPLPHPVNGFKKFWKGVGVIALIAGVLLLIGVLSGGRDILQPLGGLRVSGTGTQTAEAAHLKFAPVKTSAELATRIRQSAGKIVMLDFYADWCISCKELERFTFTDPAVIGKLKDAVLLQADVTANSADDLALLKQFNLFGPPGIIFFGKDGKEIGRVIGFEPPEKFLASLEAVLR
ncbi:MAG: protein-disulfide reductase DsbD [Sulfuricellaceae bacterium]